ncbi:MAG: DegV family protein [Oscillospiraceae bacterium]|jgi:DegV family protein with EDD domain|nr:DegV family protein [Oscillospiraceae bacterium]
MRVKISADSTCDLPREIILKYDVGIVPLYIVKGGQSYKDGVEITPDALFDYVDSGAGTCHTAAVNIADYTDAFTSYLREYDAVVHINISGALSACNQNAVIAASELPNVFVVDSQNLSTGSGHLVYDAALMAAEGAAPDEIASRIAALAPLVDASFVIDKLTYLHKGGRCSSLAALGANILKLKPCIEVTDGRMDVGKKYRSSFDKAVLQYVSDKLSDADDIDGRRIFITHPTRVPPEITRSVVETVKSYGIFDEIIESEAGCAISNHSGAVCLGVLFYRKRGKSASDASDR